MAFLLGLASLFCLGIGLLLYVQTCNLLTGLTTLERLGRKAKPGKSVDEHVPSPKNQGPQQHFEAESQATGTPESRANFVAEHFVRVSDADKTADRKLTNEDMGDYQRI